MLADSRPQCRPSDTPGSARDLNGITEILRGDMFSRRVMFGGRGRAGREERTPGRAGNGAAARGRRGGSGPGFRRAGAEELKES